MTTDTTPTYSIVANLTGQRRASGLSAADVTAWLSNRFRPELWSVTCDGVPEYEMSGADWLDPRTWAMGQATDAKVEAA